MVNFPVWQGFSGGQTHHQSHAASSCFGAAIFDCKVQEIKILHVYGGRRATMTSHNLNNIMIVHANSRKDNKTLIPHSILQDEKHQPEELVSPSAIEPADPVDFIGGNIALPQLPDIAQVEKVDIPMFAPPTPIKNENERDEDEL